MFCVSFTHMDVCPVFMIIGATDFKRDTARPHNLLEEYRDGRRHAHAKAAKHIVAVAFEHIIYA